MVKRGGEFILLSLNICNKNQLTNQKTFAFLRDGKSKAVWPNIFSFMAANTAPPQTVDLPIQRDGAVAAFPFISRQPVVVRHEPLANGVTGTFQTLELMAQCVKGLVAPDFCGYQNPQIIRFADSLIANAKNTRQEIEALFNYTAKRIRYVAHPINEQVVQDACRTIQFKTGDCVSKSVLLATLLASMDYGVKFIAQYFSDDQQYSHVYVLATDNAGNEYRLDPVASDKSMGWTQALPDGGFETGYEIF